MTTMNDAPLGYMPIPTAEQLAEALANVRCFHDMSAELTAPELLENLLAAMKAQAAPVGEREALAEKLRTDAIAIFGDGPSERDIIEWFYGALLAAAPATPAAQGAVPDALREAVEYLDDNPFNEIGAGSILHRAMRDALAAAPAHPAERQEQGEVQRLRQQVATLQSDANSWQSGYDKGREDGAKGWKSQHARDSAGLRRLCAERDHLKACQENAQLHITGLVAERNAALKQRDKLAQVLRKVLATHDYHADDGEAAADAARAALAELTP